MRVVGTIVNPKCQLIGLIFSGKETEFGGMSSQIVERRVPIGSIPNGMRTSQIEVHNGVISLKGDFKLRDLDRMEILVGNQCHPVSNKIELIKSFYNGKKLVGFAVRFDGNVVKNMTIDDIAKKSGYFEPVNFVVKVVNGNNVICGKAGVMTIDELPAVDIASNQAPKRNGRMAPVKDVKPLNEYKEVSGIEIDIFTVYDFINDNDGCIVKLPSERYRSTQDGKKVDYSGFEVETDVEVARAVPQFGEQKINATLSFKKYGTVESKETGKKYVATTYTSKCVFSNGENKMQSICVLIGQDKAGFFNNPVFKAKEIKDPEVIKALGKLTNTAGKVLIEINLSQVGLISDSRRKSCIMTNEQLKESCIALFTLKILSKYTSNRGELIKGLKKRLGNEEYANIAYGGIFYQFRNLDKETLLDMKSAGINIINGCYQRYTAAETGSNPDTYGEDNDIFIEYQYCGLDYKSITGKQMVTMAATGDTSKIPMEILQQINAIECMKSDKEKLIAAGKIQKRVDEELGKVNRRLWEHRAAMLLDGRMKYIHTHDKDSWVPDEKSRVKKYNVYLNKDFDGLTIKFKGVTI